MMITPSSVFYLSSRSFDSVNTAAVFLQSSYPEQLARAGVSTGSENTLQVDSTDLGGGLQIDSSSLKKNQRRELPRPRMVVASCCFPAHIQKGHPATG
jgi:hypothetical protein